MHAWFAPVCPVQFYYGVAVAASVVALLRLFWIRIHMEVLEANVMWCLAVIHAQGKVETLEH